MKFNGRGLDCTTVTAKSIYLFEKVFFCCSPDPNETSDNMTAVTYPYTDAMLMEDDHQPLLGAAARPTYDIESGEGGGMYEYLFSMSGIPTTATATNTNTTVVATVATEGNGIETEVLSNASFPAIASSSLSPVRRAKRAFVSDALSVVSEEPSQVSWLLFLFIFVESIYF